MAKSWVDVESSDAYLSLEDDQKQVAKEQYFNKVISAKPEYISLPDEKKIYARNQFLGQLAKTTPNDVVPSQEVKPKSVEIKAPELLLAGPSGAKVSPKNILNFFAGVSEEYPTGKVQDMIKSQEEQIPGVKPITSAITAAIPSLYFTKVLKEASDKYGEPGIDREIGKAAGDLLGLITIDAATGGVGKAVGVSKLFQGFDKAGKIGLFSRFLGAKIAHSGLTFGLKEIIDQTAELAGKRTTPGKAIEEVGKNTLFGTALGGIGSIPKAVYQIPAQAAFGYTTAKLSGQSDFSAGLNAAVFGLLGLFNMKNIDPAFMRESITGFKRSVVNQAVNLGYDKNVAEKFANLSEFKIAQEVKRRGGNMSLKEWKDLADEISAGSKRLFSEKGVPARAKPVEPTGGVKPGTEIKLKPIPKSEIPQSIQDAVNRFKIEGGRGVDWVYMQMGKAERDSVDSWLIKQKHPLAYQAGTQESRFKDIVSELVGKKVAPPEGGKVVPKPIAKPQIGIIPYSKDLKITNLDALPKGSGAGYLEVIQGEGGTYIAKQWRKNPERRYDALLIEMPKEAKAPGGGAKKITVYHGTPQEYTEMKPTIGGMFYFSESPKYASQFATELPGARIIKGNLSVKNPLDLSALGDRKINPTQFIHFMNGKGISFTPEETKFIKEQYEDYAWWYVRKSADFLSEKVKTAGYDSMTFYESNLPNEKRSKTWVVFDKSNIEFGFGTKEKIPEIKPTQELKLIIAESKKDLLQKIDEAHKAVRDIEYPEVKGEYKASEIDYKSLGIPAQIQFNFNGTTYKIWNTPTALSDFKDAAKSFSESSARLPSKFSIPRPVAAAREEIGILHRTEVPGYFTDGKMLIKGEPPAKAKYREEGTKVVTKEQIDRLLAEKGVPAAFEHFSVGKAKEEIAGVSDKQILVTGEETSFYKKPLAVFKSELGYTEYPQNQFNVIQKRFPNATYEVGKSGALLASDGGERVAVLMQIKEGGGTNPFLERPSVIVTKSGELGFPMPAQPLPETGENLPPGTMPMRYERPAGFVKQVEAPEIIEHLEYTIEQFGGTAPIRVGRFQQKALGIHKTMPEVIRLKTANDIVVASHETGHAIEKVIYGYPKGGPWRNPLINPVTQRELLHLGKLLYGKTQPTGGYKREGFAEFIRLWITNRSQAQRQAPFFYKWFDSEFLNKYPEGRKALDKGNEMVKRWQEMGAQARAQASVLDVGSFKESMRRLGKGIKSWFSFEKHIDMLKPLEPISEAAELKLKRKLKPSEDPYYTGSALRTTHDARTKVMVEDHMIDIAGNPVGPALNDIRALVRGKKKEFTIYLWAKRAIALWLDKRGPRNPGLSLKDAYKVIEELDSDKFKLAAQKVYDWNDGVLNYASEASPTFKSSVDKIRAGDSGYFVPLSREFRELDDIWSKSGVRSMATTGNISNRLKGSGRRIKDIFPTMISKARSIVKAAHNRMVIDQIIRLSKIEGMGHLVEKLPKSQVPVLKRSIDEISDAIRRELGIPRSTEIINEEIDFSDEMITFFAPAQYVKGKDPIIPIWENGKMEFYQFDEDIYKTLEGMEVYRLPQIAGLPILDKTLGISTRIFRAGTTGLRATFGLVTNPLRDIQTLYMNAKNSAKPHRLFATWLKAMVNSGFSKFGVEKNPYLDAFVRLGGEMAQPLGQDIAHTRRAARQLFEGRVIKVLDPRNWFDGLRDFLQFPESAPRVAELELVAKEIGWKPGTPMTLDQSLELLLAAKQVTTDFSAMGEFGRVMNQMFPFYNSGFQGPRANVRAALRSPKHSRRFILRGLTITAATLALWYKYKDEEWYQQMMPRERFMFWHFPVDWPQKTLLRIPRAFEVGMLFSAMPEAFIDAWYRKDPKRVKEWMETFQEVGVPNMQPVIPGEIYEQAANRDTYFDMPIVPLGIEKRPAEEQFDEYTTRTSIFLGDMFNVSPKRIDHAIRGLLGPVSMDILNVLGLGQQRPDREKELSDTALIGVLFQRESQIGPNPQVIRDVYESFAAASTKQYSTTNPETKEERQLRLMLSDATQALSALSYVKQHTPETSKRALLTLKRLEIAKKVLAAYQKHRVSRDQFAGYRKQWQTKEDRLKKSLHRK